MADQKRKLAAVLSADVVGYSRLLQSDERATLAALKGHMTELLVPGIAGGGGRVVKTMGDGILAEFDSAVAAVACAIGLQGKLTERNASVEPSRRLEFRMGLDLGDVVVDDGDIFGDGVNIAARLQALADPGGVCVSGKVFEEVRAKLEIAFQDRGPQALKNIAGTVQVYAIEAASGGTAPAGTPSAPSAAAMMNRPAVAVLPFTNMSGDPEQEYFSDGLTEDIITALTHWRSFPVIARNSTFTYKNQAVDIKQVGRELGARYVLEGSVRKGGRRVRITAQLIESDSGHHIWAGKYDRELDDIFDVQDEIAQRITATVTPELARSETKRSSTKRPEDLDAWDYYLRGMAMIHEVTPEGNAKARDMFERAIAIQHDYADAYAGLSMSYHRDILLECAEDRAATLNKVLEFARQAVKINESSSPAHHMLSTAFQWLDDRDAALLEARHGVDLNPNDATGLHALGNKSDLAGDPDGIANMERAQKLNPQDSQLHTHQTFLARAYVNAGAYEAAVARARGAIQRRPDYPHAYFILGIALGHLGRIDEAKAALHKCEELHPGFIKSRANWQPYVDPSSNEMLQAGLRRIGIEEVED